MDLYSALPGYVIAEVAYPLNLNLFQELVEESPDEQTSEPKIETSLEQRLFHEKNPSTPSVSLGTAIPISGLVVQALSGNALTPTQTAVTVGAITGAHIVLEKINPEELVEPRSLDDFVAEKLENEANINSQPSLKQALASPFYSSAKRRKVIRGLTSAGRENEISEKLIVNNYNRPSEVIYSGVMPPTILAGTVSFSYGLLDSISTSMLYGFVLSGIVFTTSTLDRLTSGDNADGQGIYGKITDVIKAVYDAITLPNYEKLERKVNTSTRRGDRKKWEGLMNRRLDIMVTDGEHAYDSRLKYAWEKARMEAGTKGMRQELEQMIPFAGAYQKLTIPFKFIRNLFEVSRRTEYLLDYIAAKQAPTPSR